MSLRMRTAALTAIAALAIGGATSTAADARPKRPAPAVTCAGPGGTQSSPGDEMVSTTVIRDSHGRVVGHSHETSICGEDGQWHLVSSGVTARTVARAARINTGGGTPHGCSNPNGSVSDPGDTKTNTTTTRVKGRTFVVRDTFICGEDGQWHLVA